MLNLNTLNLLSDALIKKSSFSESELKELVKGIDSLKSQKKAA